MEFKFGVPGSSGPASNSTTSTAPAEGSLFTSTPGTTKPTFPFGGDTSKSSTTPSGNLFGKTAAATPGAGLFGGQSTTPATWAPATGGIFGGTSTTPAANPFSGAGNALSTTPSTGGLFGGQGDENKQAAATPTPGGNLFGNAGSNMFGNKAGSTTSDSSAALTMATPAKTSFPLPSTTPAGAPPVSDVTKAAGSSLFPGTQSAGFSFGGPAAAKPGSTTSASESEKKAPALSGFFGNTGASANASTGNLFGGTAATTPAAPTGGLFAGVATGTTQPTPTPSVVAPASTGTTSSLFGGAKPDAASTAAPAPAAAATGSLFGVKPAATTTSAAPTPAATAAPATGGLFGGATPAAAATKPTTSFFGTTPASATTSQPAAASAAAITNPITTSTDKKEPERKEAAPSLTQPSTTAASLGASTRGPPSQMARLKNKTMEDIVTRWASDLSKYQKEFKEQATIVSTWDRNLVENGEKIQKLYLDTFEAERASHEIERQLAAVEGQQEELEAWLNRYESEVQDMFSKQMGPGEQLGGPDQERERTYKLAEKLTQQLDEKSRDLSKMVKEINDISGTLSVGTKAEDPMSQIVRVLNSHLTQLQWIDANASALQAKVASAQKSSSNLGSHYGGGESDTTESFYRSYMGRR